MIELASTIYAIATGPVHTGGSRALLRISGPGVRSLCAAIAPSLNTLTPGARSTVLHIYAAIGLAAPRPNELPSELATLAILSLAPHSFTGQDSLELLLPANPTLVDLVISTMRRASEQARHNQAPYTHAPHDQAPHNQAPQGGPISLRQALPGEFAARAVILGKLDAARAEAIGALVSAANAGELAAARAVLSGALGSQYRAWADELATLLALVEAGIDFADQEGVTAISAPNLAARSAALAGAMQSLLGARSGARLHTGRVRIALAGKPNAGKSTLFNALLDRARAATSPIAGTTRDVLIEPLTLTRPGGRSINVELMDLAGLDAALADRSASDQQAIAAARRSIASADVIVWCHAANDPSPPLSHDLLPGDSSQRQPDQLPPYQPQPDQRQPSHITVATKADSIHAPLASDLTTTTTNTTSPTISICALDGRGLGTLRNTLFDLAWSRGHAQTPMDILPRHRDGLTDAAAELADLAGPHCAPDELAAASLRHALDLLGQLTGQVGRDAILGRIYATFCIGK